MTVSRKKSRVNEIKELKERKKPDLKQSGLAESGNPLPH